MGCFASRPASITPTGSPRPPLLLASSVSGLPQSKSPVGNKVAPNTPVALTTVVPVSPPGPPAQDPISPDKRKKLHIVVSSPQSGVAPECARSPTPHEPLVEGPARSSPTALRPPDPSVDPVVAAMSDVMKPSGSAPPSLILPTSPRSLSIGEVVSAKAAAARKARRGTVESTELRESLDTNGRKVVNQ